MTAHLCVRIEENPRKQKRFCNLQSLASSEIDKALGKNWQHAASWLLEEELKEVSDQQLYEQAILDLGEINSADVFLLFDTPSTSGGKWVELGYALRSNKTIIYWRMPNEHSARLQTSEGMIQLPHNSQQWNPFLCLYPEITTVYNFAQLITAFIDSTFSTSTASRCRFMEPK